MTPQELKNSILQLAIQGKLVEQRPEEGTGEELYQQIQAEKKKLIAEGKIKKEKTLPEITEEEIPFEIPEDWKWVRLANLVTVLGDGIHGTPIYDDMGEYYFINGNNLVKGNIEIKDDTKKVSLIEYEKYKKPLDANTILLSINGTIGNYAFYDEEPVILGKRACYFSLLGDIDKKYVCYLLNTKFFSDYAVKEATQTTIKNVSLKAMRMLPVPLPPLAEQKRIVAKIEELLPYIDRYEVAWSKLEEFNKRFPGDMQKSILQMAIQGKLVEQRPEEGTGEELYQQIQAEKKKFIAEGKIKKEKPLPEITEEEIPFEIPENWKWVKLGSILRKLVDGTHRTPKYTTSGVPFVSVRNMSDGKLSLKDTKFISEEEHRELWNRCNPEKNDILLSKVGTTGVPAKVETDTEFSLFVSVALLKFNNDLLDIDFLIYSILAPNFQKQCKEHTRGVGNKNWVIVDIANTIMPLPPLAEQKRIVAKLEELLPLCERLK